VLRLLPAYPRNFSLNSAAWLNAHGRLLSDPSAGAGFHWSSKVRMHEHSFFPSNPCFGVDFFSPGIPCFAKKCFTLDPLFLRLAPRSFAASTWPASVSMHLLVSVLTPYVWKRCSLGSPCRHGSLPSFRRLFDSGRLPVDFGLVIHPLCSGERPFSFLRELCLGSLASSPVPPHLTWRHHARFNPVFCIMPSIKMAHLVSCALGTTPLGRVFAPQTIWTSNASSLLVSFLVCESFHL